VAEPLRDPVTPEMERALHAPYTVGFGCADTDPLQRALNALYEYEQDIETRVLHRSRLNLFWLLMQHLAVRGLIRGRRRALDVGCNAGYYSKLIGDFGFSEVLGIDIEPAFIERAQAHFGSDLSEARRAFRVQDAETIETRADCDFILCTEVIEHTAHPERVVRNISEALAPGGIAVVTLPNAMSVPYGWALLVHALRGRPLDPVLRDHVQFPSYRSVRLFDPHGLRLVATTGTNLFFFGPVLRVLGRSPMFPILHRADFGLSRRWPLKFAAQFFYMVLQKPAA